MKQINTIISTVDFKIYQTKTLQKGEFELISKSLKCCIKPKFINKVEEILAADTEIILD